MPKYIKTLEIEDMEAYPSKKSKKLRFKPYAPILNIIEENTAIMLFVTTLPPLALYFLYLINSTIEEIKIMKLFKSHTGRTASLFQLFESILYLEYYYLFYIFIKVSHPNMDIKLTLLYFYIFCMILHKIYYT